MHRISVFVICCLLSALCAACGGSSASAQSMTAANLKGAYAGEFSGEIKTASGYTPFDGTGVFIADGNGHLSGHETYTSDGRVCDATIAGTYQIAADGTGTVSLAYTGITAGCGSGTYTQSLVLGGSGQVAYLANTDGNQISEQWHLQ